MEQLTDLSVCLSVCLSLSLSLSLSLYLSIYLSIYLFSVALQHECVVLGRCLRERERLSHLVLGEEGKPQLPPPPPPPPPPSPPPPWPSAPMGRPVCPVHI